LRDELTRNAAKTLTPTALFEVEVTIRAFPVIAEAVFTSKSSFEADGQHPTHSR